MAPPTTTKFEYGDFVYIIENYEDGRTVIDIRPKDWQPPLPVSTGPTE